MNRQQIADSAALAAAKACEARGCTCLHEQYPNVVAPGVIVVDVLHDPGCPAITPEQATR